MTNEPLRGQPSPQGDESAGRTGSAKSVSAAAPDSATASGKPVGTRFGLSNYLGLALALVAMIVLFSLLSSHFLTYDTFSTIANQIPDLVVMAVGMTFVLIIAGIDLSVGSVLALAPRW